jgi:hypothetical protein
MSDLRTLTSLFLVTLLGLAGCGGIDVLGSS